MAFSNPSIPRANAAWLADALARLRRLAASAQVLGIVDQVVVSGASFAATLLVGRTNSAALGEYSIAISVIATVLAVQNALVLLPFTIRLNGAAADTRADAGDALALSTVLSLAAAVVCGVVSAAAAIMELHTVVFMVALTLGAIMPFVALREFARRFALARLRMSAVLMLDAGAAAIQIAGLGALTLMHALTAVTASIVLGLSCAIPSVAAALVAGNDFAVSAPRLRAAAERSWSLGKWL